ncbi:copper amine oxidase N-terminal domain-containing protein [Anaerobacillus sp. HL2]|nr:copper amine oxidase N-terminal domain-containing protein [Anaerobacillus sp. HL2]
MRAIFEALDAQVHYEPTTKVITASRNNTTVILTVGSKIAYINNSRIELDVPAQAANSRTLVLCVL